MLPDPPVLAVFLAATVAITLTPGPDMLYVMSRGLGQGPRVGAVSTFGVIAGTFVHLGVAAIGLSGLFRFSPLAFEIVRYAGAGFLLYLAWRAIADGGPLAVPGNRPPVGLRRAFAQGLLTNLLNPKVGLFYLSFLPQFVEPARGPVAAQVLILGGMLNGLGLVVNLSVALAAGRLGRWLKAHPRLARAQAWVSASILAALAVRLLIPDRR